MFFFEGSFKSESKWVLQSCVKPRQLNAEGQKVSRCFPVLMNLQTLPSFSAVLCTVIFARTLKKGMFPLVGEDLAFETKPHVHCLSMKGIVWELACALQEHCSVSPTTGCFRLRSNFICVGRGGENDAATTMTTVLWNIKGSHMLALNSPIFSSCLRKVKISLLGVVYQGGVINLEWPKSSPRCSMFMGAFLVLSYTPPPNCHSWCRFSSSFN